MRIAGQIPVELKATNPTGRAGSGRLEDGSLASNAAAGAPADQVTLSQPARRIVEQPPWTAERVHELRALIESGKLKIDSVLIARLILDGG